MNESAKTISPPGQIAARIDRLALTWTQWRLTLISQIFWRVIVAADGIPTRLYPFTLGAEKAFGLSAFSLLLAERLGVDILVRECLCAANRTVHPLAKTTQSA